MTRARTRKWEFVKQEAMRLAALGVSKPEVCERLGIDRSTLTRWTQQGRLAWKPGPAAVALAAQPGQTPDEWAAALRAEFQLSATDDQILGLAVIALKAAHDARTPTSAKMVAAGRYQALVRQLALKPAQAPEQPASPAEPDETPAPRKTNPVVQRPSTGDPRALLMAVK